MIVEAAIKQDGEIYRGLRHNNIIHAMVSEHGIKPPVSGEQGFVDDEGSFYTRREAALHALRSGQIKHLKYSDTELYSEDLY